jgi:hypothetical protein
VIEQVAFESLKVAETAPNAAYAMMLFGAVAWTL